MGKGPVIKHPVVQINVSPSGFLASLLPICSNGRHCIFLCCLQQQVLRIPFLVPMPAQPFALSRSLHVATHTTCLITHAHAHGPRSATPRPGSTKNASQPALPGAHNTTKVQHATQRQCTIHKCPAGSWLPAWASASSGLLSPSDSIYCSHFPLYLAHSLLLYCVCCQQPSPKNNPAAHHRPRTHGSNFSSCARRQNRSSTQSIKQATNRCPCRPSSSTDLHTGKCCSR